MTEISVIMPLYNGETYLAETLESYQRNAFPGVELIVVDDGSTDSSVEILKTKVPSVKLLTQTNGGPSKARNLALQKAEGTYIAFLDADDLWPPGTLEKLHGALSHNLEAGIAQGKIETFASGPVAEQIRHRLKDEPFYGVNLGSSLFKREDLLRMGGLDETLRHGEDTDFWFRCWEEGLEKTLVPHITLRYRLHNHNMTTEAASDAKMLLPLLKKHRDRMRGRTPKSSVSLTEYLGW